MLHEVQTTVNEEGSKVSSPSNSSDDLEPFSPPATPDQKDTPTLFGENPFVSDAFINMPAKKFRDSRYDSVVGDPFQNMDPFSECSERHSINTSSEDFVDFNSPNELQSNSHKHISLGSPFSDYSTSSERGHTTHSLTTTDKRSHTVHVSTATINIVQQPSPNLSRPHSSQSSHTSSRESLRGSINITTSSQESLKQSSVRDTSRNSFRSNERLSSSSVESVRSRSPLSASQDSLGIGKTHSGSPSHSIEGSVGSTGSSPRLSTRRSERSSTASFQEVVVEERIEPVLQVSMCINYSKYLRHFVF